MPLQQAERDRAVAELQSSAAVLLDTVTGLSTKQWGFKPAPGRWSIAECVEHIALTEDYYFDLVTTKVLSSAAQPPNRDARTNDEAVQAIMRDRSAKRIAWQNLAPSGRCTIPDAAIDHFRCSRARMIDYVRTTTAELRDHREVHRAAGPIDAFQWILLASAHVRRHTDQIIELKMDPRFPRNSGRRRLAAT